MRWCVMVLCLGFAVDAHAQRFLHDAKRDATAQDAVTTAKDITNGSLFDTMLKNVDAQAKLEADTTMAGVEQRMRAQIQAFNVWHSTLATPVPANATLTDLAQVECRRSMRCALEVVERRLTLLLASPDMTGDQIKARQAALVEKAAALKTALQALQAKLEEKNKAAAKDAGVLRALALLDDQGKDILEYADKIAQFAEDHTKLKGATKALDAIGDGLDQVLVVYHAVLSVWTGNQAVSVDPASLRPLQEQLDLQLLAVESDYLKTRARIEARRFLEVNAALNQVQSVLTKFRQTPTYNAKGEKQEKVFLSDSTEEIEFTLGLAAKDARRDRLTDLLQLLHDASAVTAQMDAAGVLANLRAGDEKRRYAVRVSTVNASTYDTTIQAAVSRLALYWKGGVKPGDLAQLAFYLTNSIAIPAIAIKQ